MTDIINEEENSNQIPKEIEDIAVVDNGTTYESTESAIIAKEEADKAKLWAQESERQANLASGSADTAAQARDDAVAAKEYAEAAITDTNLITVATDLQSTPSNIKTVAQNITGINDIAVNLSTVLDAKNQAIAAANSASSALTYENKARNWAIEMDGLVDGEDYSAKYYANQARQAASGAIDNKTITLNANNEHQAIGVINQNTTDAVKIWSGTKEDYEDITHSNDTVYLVVGVGIYIGDIQVSAGGGGGEIGDIGFAPLGIDEAQNKRRYLNGQVISQAQFVSFTNKIKSAIELYPSLATSETNWQAEVTNSKLGQCGKFVIDDTAGTIRLPKVVNINGLTDLSLIGGIKAESLPNIKGGDSSNQNSLISPVNSKVGNYGAVSIIGNADGSNRTQIGGEAGVLKRAVLNASLSSSTYQDNAPVQQEAIQYPYFIQVATGVEESVDVSTEIQLNNPFSLLDYKWSEYELNNASWLLSNGQFNSGATYPSVYELLLKIKNGTETKDGVSVKLSTEAYTDTDFVINTANTTFRLPIKVKLASGNRVAGNGMTLGLTDGTNNYGLVHSDYSIHHNTEGTDNYGLEVGVHNSVLGIEPVNYDCLGITTDPTKSGIETSSQGLKLYFYVGETIQDANVIAASQVLTDVATIKGYDYVVESYKNGTDWYRIYKSGWVEQGGIADHGSVGYDWNQVVTLLKAFKNTNYIVLTDCLYSSGGGQMSYHGQKTTSAFKIYQSSKTNAVGSSRYVNWYACGQGE